MPSSSLFVFSFLGASLLLASPARSEDSTFRLSDALARAAENNPGLVALAFGERAADALIEQAGQRPPPTLEITAENFAGTGTRQGVRALETTVQASQSIERGGKREKRIASATRDREAAAREFALKRAEVLGVTAVAYVETLSAQQRAAFAEEPVKLAREILAAAEARVRAGAASPVESARARATLAMAQAEHARTLSDLVAARARLAATWNGTAGDVPPLPGKLQVPAALASESGLLGKLPAHPRIARQQALVASRRAALELERAQALSDLSVGGGIRFLRENSDAALVAGVSFPLPVRQRNQGNIRAAREQLAGAEQAVRAVEAELRTEFASAWQEANAAHAAALHLRREALPATQEAHAVVRRAYDDGQLPLIDVLDAQRELVSLRRELLELETKFIAAHARAEALADPQLPATSALLSLP